MKSTCPASHMCDEKARTADESRISGVETQAIRSLEEKDVQKYEPWNGSTRVERSPDHGQQLTKRCVLQRECKRGSARICL